MVNIGCTVCVGVDMGGRRGGRDDRSPLRRREAPRDKQIKVVSARGQLEVS